MVSRPHRQTHVRRLALWMNGERVGTWSITQGRHELQYADNWLQSPHARPLSLTLPFTPGNQPHRGEHVGTWFDNLLPDIPQLRERIAARFKTKSKSAFDLLTEVGRDSVGALRFLPEEASSTDDVKTIQAHAMGESDVANLLRSSTLAQPWLDGDLTADDFRISLAGAQEKVALLKFNGQWMRPLGATPTTHILKLPLGLVGNLPINMTNSVENEWLCAQILKAYGLSVANCTIEEFEGIKVLAVERFDRTLSSDGSWIMRLPQEDMCQALGYPSHLKYEADGGPGMDKILSLLSGSNNAHLDKINFVKAQFVFWLLCATDGHAKNFSIHIKAGGSFAMTPLYDVLSVYPALDEGPGLMSAHKVRMAMAVRSKSAHWKIRDIQMRHWYALAERHGISALGAHSPFTQVLEQTSDVLAQVEKALPKGFPHNISGPIFNGLLATLEKLASA